MSYNPTRTAGGNKRRTRKMDPHAGTKHSDIMKRRGVGQNALTSKREDTRHGYTSDVFSCKEFSQRFVCLYAGNNTGVGVNSKGSRTVRVMAGTLYVTRVNKVKETDDSGNVIVKDVADIENFPVGHTVSFPKGDRYSLASSGTTHVELLITETTGYQSTWKELEDAVVTTPQNVMVVPPKTATARRPRGESKARRQAQQMSGKRGEAAARSENRRRSVSDNVNSSTVVGVNPRPSGPPPADD